MSDGTNVEVLERPKGEVNPNVEILSTPKPEKPKDLNGKSDAAVGVFGRAEGLTQHLNQTELRRKNETEPLQTGPVLHKEGAVGEFKTDHDGKKVSVLTYTNPEGKSAATVEVTSDEDELNNIRIDLQKEEKSEDHGLSDTLSRKTDYAGTGDIDKIEEVADIVKKVSTEAHSE